MTRALVVLVHGTPRPESNEAMFEIVERVRATGRFAPVEAGFLDINEPDIPTAIDRCVEAGAHEIICVPYFLHAGRHVRHDIPEILEEASARHPSVSIVLGEYIGARHELAAALIGRFRTARTAGD